MGDTAVPTPFSQLNFFKSLSFSLSEYDWYNFMEQWQAMVAVNAPIPEFSHNLEPFFTNAKRLLPVFHRYMGHVRKDPEFLNTLTTVLMSTPLLIKVQDILRSQTLFSKYVAALKMDNLSASHNQVMQAIQTFLAELPDPTRLALQRAFIEAEASDSMGNFLGMMVMVMHSNDNGDDDDGLSSSTLETAFHILHSDTQLYIDVLTTMQLNQTRNMPWETVVSKIKTLVNAKKPYAWVGMDQFLKHLHSGHYQEQQGYYDAYGDEGDYAEYEYEYRNEYEYGDDSSTIRKVDNVNYHPEEQGQDVGVGKVLDGFAKLTVADRDQAVAT
ncbi:hypothetical protein BGZ51_002401 [Haplosporangium sp. Z 767]|nr:hypothetical protein BGZ51_002401 [Haplosporangium sp. Z 767]KAF9194406.1 hypothetical protein BGZ50_006322 [Haplosporangium sp. Z 11]